MDRVDDQPTLPVDGMTITVRRRADVVVVDPHRFLTAARRAYRELHPEVTEQQAAQAVVDVYDAAHTLLDRYGELGSDHPDVAAGGTTIRHLPGERVRGRPDGLSPAGSAIEVVLGEPRPLQDYGCFFDDRDLFGSPGC